MPAVSLCSVVRGGLEFPQSSRSLPRFWEEVLWIAASAYVYGVVSRYCRKLVEALICVTVGVSQWSAGVRVVVRSLISLSEEVSESLHHSRWSEGDPRKFLR